MFSKLSFHLFLGRTFHTVIQGKSLIKEMVLRWTRAKSIKSLLTNVVFVHLATCFIVDLMSYFPLSFFAWF